MVDEEKKLFRRDLLIFAPYLQDIKEPTPVPSKNTIPSTALKNEYVSWGGFLTVGICTILLYRAIQLRDKGKKE